MAHYEKHDWDTGEIITTQKMNHIEDGIEDSVKYDLILTNKLNGTSFEDLGASDVEIVKGSIGDVEDAIEDGHPINAVFIWRNWWSSISSGSNSHAEHSYFPLSTINAPYRDMMFASLDFSLHDQTAPFQPRVGMVELHYNSNGTISSVYTGSKILIATN